ncbi:hypothetical protein [Lysobacter fragariae]
MKVPLPTMDKARLAGAVADALHEAFRNLKLSEPQLVANLVSALPKRVNQISFSGSTKVKAGGVFVHARPFVACDSFPVSSPKSVEIGDLLLIRTLVVNGQVKERRALLLQAKKVDRIPATPDNKNQWHLYEQWPRFTYAARSGGLTGKKRRIKEPDMYDAAKYLLIDSDPTARHWHQMCCVDWPFHQLNRWPGTCIHSTAQPTVPEISRYRCFVGELVDFLVGNTGKVFAKPAARTRGWNRVVHDLIGETAKAKTIFMGRTAQQSSTSARGSGVLFLALADQADFFLVAGDGGPGASNGSQNAPGERGKNGDGNGSHDVPTEWGEDGDGGGISIVEVIVEQGQT